MLRNRRVRIILVLVISFLLVETQSLIQPSPAQMEVPHQARSFKQSESDSPVSISSDEDFESQGWPGDGSEMNPFVISGLNITSPSTCISITSTSFFVIIEDCYLRVTRYDRSFGINLSNLSYALIRNNMLVDCGIYLTDADGSIVENNQIERGRNYGISLQDSSHVQLKQNIISSATSFGIKTDSSLDCSVSGNIISDCISGISVNDQHDSTFTFNHISETSSYGIAINSGTNNVLVGNALATESEAIDNGQTNQWDDDQSIGNYWQNFRSSDSISINGSAGSLDQFPLEVEKSWSGWFWSIERLPWVYRFPIQYGDSANQDKLGWIIWSYPGQIRVSINNTQIIDDYLSGSGSFYLHTSTLQDGLYHYYLEIDLNEYEDGWFSFSVNVLDSRFVTYPDVPENLVANTVGPLVDLTWNPPTFDGGNPIIEYLVYRGTRPEEMVPIATVETSSYQDDISELGRYVFYAVSAKNGFREGEVSDYICNRETHEAITIDSNSDFADQGWSGDGTESNPYLISNYFFRSNESSISITAVDAFFVIENCWITNDDRYGGNSPGIEMVNVSNGNIRSSVIANKESGILLTSSRDCVISNCTTYRNDNGISVTLSENCTIKDSQLSDHTRIHINVSKTIVVENSLFSRYDWWNSRGIFTANSSVCTFKNCTFDDLYSAVQLTYSQNLTLTENQFLSCRRGVELETCQDILIERNWLNRCRYGFEVYRSLAISLSNCEIIYSNQFTRGIYLWESTYCEFSNVTLRNSIITVNGYNRTHWNHIFYNVSIDDLALGYFFDIDNTSIIVDSYSQCLISYCTDLNVSGNGDQFKNYGIHIMNCSRLKIDNIARASLEISNSSVIVLDTLSLI
ncbi:MAG: right-handed parallel beta-helix repeat-containing protein, partial [Candidatus Thorarchaeota archaeon]